MSLTFARSIRQMALGVFVVLAVVRPANATDITGAGSTFVYPLMVKWAEAYKAKTGNTVNYQAVGSEAGINQIKEKTIDFGATDKPLFPIEVNASDLMQFPMVIGGIVPVMNLSGIKPGELVLDGATLANIYMGKITTWDDPALKRLNPNVVLPATPITVVHRSDGSGTTFNFTEYLGAMNTDWQAEVGADLVVKWPVGVGANGNEGVATMTLQTPGAMGYVEYAYALQKNLTYAKMINHDGVTVEPGGKSFRTAATNADSQSTFSFRLNLTNQPGNDSWPITASTFILIYAPAGSPQAGQEVRKFFDWVFHEGQQQAEDLQYVPLPDNLVAQIEAAWAERFK